jgi:hypothetical protein
MTNWKLPPKAKIYEAFSVLADERYVIQENSALITSSDGKKQYSVEWIPRIKTGESLKITSNDNASYWQGYMGYPIIAVLMIIKEISLNEEILPYFKDIPWNALNKAAKNDYDSVVKKVLSGIADKEVVKRINFEVENIFIQLGKMKLEPLGKVRRPPGK